MSQQHMVRVASGNHRTPEAAATQFGDDTQNEARERKQEPNAGIVKMGLNHFAYTVPHWGGVGENIVDVGEYIEALIAVYVKDVAGLVHTHYDQLIKFSPTDAYNSDGWVYFMPNQNGGTYKLNYSIVRKALRDISPPTLQKYLFIYNGIQGQCIAGCP